MDGRHAGQPLETDAGTDLQIGVSGRADVHVDLRRLTEVPTSKGVLTVSSLTFLVDEPREFAAHAGGYLTAKERSES